MSLTAEQLDAVKRDLGRNMSYTCVSKRTGLSVDAIRLIAQITNIQELTRPKRKHRRMPPDSYYDDDPLSSTVQDRAHRTAMARGSAALLEAMQRVWANG